MAKIKKILHASGFSVYKLLSPVGSQGELGVDPVSQLKHDGLGI